MTRAPNAFWRHDVDLSLAAAEKMARFAQLAGITSTFYLMPRSEHYNLFSHEGEQALLTILANGHRVGIHVDHRTGSPKAAVARDVALVDAGYPGTFTDRLVSFHMPRFSVLWHDFTEFSNAYGKQWKNRYVSDSRGEWDDTKDERVADHMQISLHPEHWFSA